MTNFVLKQLKSPEAECRGGFRTALHRVVCRDPTLWGIYNLPEDWMAFRESKDAPWYRTLNPRAEGDDEP